jgi:hypothetical protein
VPFVLAVNLTPVASLAAVTVAPSIPAPDASVTWPEIEPVEIAFWASALIEITEKAINKIIQLHSVFIFRPALNPLCSIGEQQELPQIRYSGKGVIAKYIV